MREEWDEKGDNIYLWDLAELAGEDPVSGPAVAAVLAP
jgi:hypothetical protein